MMMYEKSGGDCGLIGQTVLTILSLTILGFCVFGL